MNFIRTIINSDKLDNIVKIPEELKHQNVEVLILPINDKEKKSNKKFNPDNFAGILKMDSKKLEMELKSMRDEWDRF